MVKVLKIKTGSVYIEGKTYNVMTEAWETEGKSGKKYYELRLPIFVNEVNKKPEIKEEIVEA